MIIIVMIVSYETLRTLSVHLANCSIGLLLCDEGHRLKNSGWYNPNLRNSSILHRYSESLTFQALNGLDVKRRVILTGTPIQVLVPIQHDEDIYHSFLRMIFQNIFLFWTLLTQTSWVPRTTSARTSRMLSFVVEIRWPVIQSRLRARRSWNNWEDWSPSSLFAGPMTFYRSIVCIC